MIRWAPYVLAGFALGPIDWDRGVRDFLEKASPKGRLGVRVGLFLAMTAPLWMWGRLSTARGLRGEDRGRLLHELLEHRIFLVRELTLLIKLVACMAMLRDDAVRESTGYYGAPAKPARALLPVIREVA